MAYHAYIIKVAKAITILWYVRSFNMHITIILVLKCLNMTSIAKIFSGYGYAWS